MKNNFEPNYCNCCMENRTTPEWFYNFTAGVKICNECYDNLKESEKKLFFDTNSSKEVISAVLEFVRTRTRKEESI